MGVYLKSKVFLSFFDFFRFCKYLTDGDAFAKRRVHIKFGKQLALLVRSRNGCDSGIEVKHIFYYSSFHLSKNESAVLSRGLEFCIPPIKIDKEETLAAFEVLFSQLVHHVPCSSDHVITVKSRLKDLAYRYCNSSVDSFDFVWSKTQFKIVKSNNDIYISKPDTGAGVVRLDRVDYIQKMLIILNDSEKFLKIGPVETCDNTYRNEIKMQKRLLYLFRKGYFSKETYDMIRPSGSLRPRFYGLPKVHKKDVPLRPVLSMIGSAQHSLAQWLLHVIQPVRTF